MFIAALFTTARTRKQLRCPVTDEWIKKMWYIYIYNGILLSHKKNEIMPSAAAWIDLKSIILSEVKSDKDKYMISLTCGT